MAVGGSKTRRDARHAPVRYFRHITARKSTSVEILTTHKILSTLRRYNINRLPDSLLFESHSSDDDVLCCAVLHGEVANFSYCTSWFGWLWDSHEDKLVGALVHVTSDIHNQPFPICIQVTSDIIHCACMHLLTADRKWDPLVLTKKILNYEGSILIRMTIALTTNLDDLFFKITTMAASYCLTVLYALYLFGESAKIQQRYLLLPVQYWYCMYDTPASRVENHSKHTMGTRKN